MPVTITNEEHGALLVVRADGEVVSEDYERTGTGVNDELGRYISSHKEDCRILCILSDDVRLSKDAVLDDLSLSGDLKGVTGRCAIVGGNDSLRVLIHLGSLFTHQAQMCCFEDEHAARAWLDEGRVKNVA